MKINLYWSSSARAVTLAKYIMDKKNDKNIELIFFSHEPSLEKLEIKSKRK